MARAAVLPPSPAKRGTRTAPRSTLTKTTASSQAKAATAPKRVTKTTTARKNTRATQESDSDDTEDELGMMMQGPEMQSARPRGRPPARPSSRTAATASSAAKTITRPNKATPAPTATATSTRTVRTSGATQPTEPIKKRVGRPKKSTFTTTTTTSTTAATPAIPPKPRGRPKGSTTAKAPVATRRNDRAAAETEAVANPSAKQIRVNTNSTTMRSNLLRGPAKKKTVTFREPNGAEEDQLEEDILPSPSDSQSSESPHNTGLRATPMRKSAASTTRARKGSTAKKRAGKPLSPKKDNQITKSLASYVSSDGEEDELLSSKYNPSSPLKSVIDSPSKEGLGVVGLSSPVRRVNFTPQKPSSAFDENGEPKCSTPKNSGTGLSSPVRRINFTPSTARPAVLDSDFQSSTLGKPVDFSDSVFMSSPAKRPEASPFQFSLRDTPNRGLLFRQESQSNAESPTREREASPLKRSPRKANLGASFSEMNARDSVLSSAKKSLIQSPPKRIPSPFKISVQSLRAVERISSTEVDEDIIHLPSPRPETSTAISENGESGPRSATDEVQIVEDVARDIFGIELRCYGRSSSFSPLPRRLFALEEALEPTTIEVPVEGDEEVERDTDAVDVEDQIQELRDEIQREPEDFGTVCLTTMEDLQVAFENLPDDQGLGGHSETEHDYDAVEEILSDEEYGEMTGSSIAADGVIEEDQVVFAHEDYPEESVLVLQDSEDVHSKDIGNSFTNGAEESVVPTPQSKVQEEVNRDMMGEGADEDLGQARPQSAETEACLSPSGATAMIAGEAVASHSSSLSSRISGTPGSVSGAHSMRCGSPCEDVVAQPDSPILDGFAESRINLDDSTVNITGTESVSPVPSGGCQSPCFNGKRQSLDNLGVGFTPLARKLDNWEPSASSATKPTKSRRRGIFSLAGYPGKTIEGSPPVEDVSYPDISKAASETASPLLPHSTHQTDVNDKSPIPSSPRTPPSAITQLSQSIMYSPIRLDIFEDSEVSDADSPNMEHEHLGDISKHGGVAEASQHSSIGDDDDKENFASPLNLPATPLHRGIDQLRTVHTVYKVPLKGEGEVSPLKLPRKRGHSLESRSPVRSSPRVRKPVKLFSNDPVSIFSPRKEARVPPSPSPKRRCSAPRRSNGAESVIQVPQSPSVASTAGKTPRRKSISREQALQGAVVYVDVHTTEGEDASGIFVELLQQMGARCFRSWSWNPRSSLSPVDGEEPKESKVGITHVVYKDGGLRTLEKVKYAGGLVKCVGVGWVLDCERENKWLDEAPYMVDSSIVPRGGAKRRKSMEPRALSNVKGTLVRIAEPSTPSASGRRCGADQGAVDGFRKITPPTPLAGVPSTPTQKSERYTVPATPGYNFENLDAIGMSPATPYFLSNRAKLVQQSCPPKQSNRGLFDSVDRPTFSLEADDEAETRRQQRARMEAARRKSHFYQPAIQSPLRE
ncbi:Uncharacterized protein PECH_002193 [Penicillium ucsense]|uniref:BRCT domain-containing protein n=1 Tax=Penicillium ucsense TaxID=2839758 RepID=A0A8J8VZE9_9EURO|nr:Uncharacterized protein PECM_008339 [Penicillium ucsense]KAF7731156.1 Uncharacterized protein PECH_002193 [Penicillium ucsense]